MPLTMEKKQLLRYRLLANYVRWENRFGAAPLTHSSDQEMNRSLGDSFQQDGQEQAQVAAKTQGDSQAGIQ